MNAKNSQNDAYWLWPRLRENQQNWIQHHFYVTMSRCKSYENFWIYSDEEISEKHIQINEDVYDYLND